MRTPNTLFRVTLLLGLFAASYLLAPEPVMAQTIDQRCFTKKQCDEVRAQFGATGDGFVTGKFETQKACGQQTPEGDALGFCLPPGKTRTTIAFGGRQNFENLGDFIQYGYRYAIFFAGLLAVIMIIASGIQWSASGGNSSTIESAKKRIAGAITGLIIAVTSYTILSTLNPNTVNLRLPQVWMINAINLAPSLCTDVKADTSMALAASEQEQTLSEEDLQKRLDERINNQTNIFKKQETTKFTCGARYFVAGSGSLTCQGMDCKQGQVCMTDTTNDPNGNTSEKRNCIRGVIAGKIYHSGFVDKAIENSFGALGRGAKEGWAWGFTASPLKGWIYGPNASREAIQLEAVCNDGGFDEKIGSVHYDSIKINEQTQTQFYVVQVDNIEAAIRKAKSDCSTDGGLKGFVLEVQMNEAGDVIWENHYLGKIGTLAVDLGNDNAIDQTIVSAATNQYMITEEDLRKGIVLDIDVAKVFDIDEDADYSVYNQYGFFLNQVDRAVWAAEEAKKNALRQSLLNP